MIIEILTVVIILAFTLLALRRNAVIYLSIGLVIIYFLEIFILYFQGMGGISLYFNLFACNSNTISLGTFTGIYLHSLNPMHIFFNLLFLFLIGIPFEQRVGSFKLTVLFLISGILANIGYSMFLHFMGIESYLIGASGAIFGLMGAFLVLYPEDEITMFLGPILMPRVKVKYAVLAFMAVEFAASFLWVNDNVAHGAHVIGAVSGAVLAYFMRDTRIKGSDRKDVNYSLLENMADTDDLRYIYSKIRGEQDEVIRDSWILEFFRKKYGDAEFQGKYVKSGNHKYRIFR